MRSHEQIDQRSLAMACAVAEKLERQPALLEVARGNLERWIAAGGNAPQRAHVEWLDLLARTTLPSLLQLLRSDSEQSRRLRQSSPFAGVLSPEERWRILCDSETRSA